MFPCLQDKSERCLYYAVDGRKWHNGSPVTCLFSLEMMIDVLCHAFTTVETAMLTI
jgi:hypothetical protein